MWSLLIVSKFITVFHIKFQTLVRLNKNVTPQCYRAQLQVVATASASAGEPVVLTEALHHLLRSADCTGLFKMIVGGLATCHKQYT